MHEIRYKKKENGVANEKMKYSFVDTLNQVFHIKILLFLYRAQYSSDKICKIQNE